MPTSPRKKSTVFSVAVSQLTLAELDHKLRFLDIKSRSVSSLIRNSLELLNDRLSDALTQRNYVAPSFTREDAISHLSQHYGQAASTPRGQQIDITLPTISDTGLQADQANRIAKELKL